MVSQAYELAANGLVRLSPYTQLAQYFKASFENQIQKA